VDISHTLLACEMATSVDSIVAVHRPGPGQRLSQFTEEQEHAALEANGAALRQDTYQTQWRIIALASLGGSLEFYDFIIYGIFAQYIARQFFPANDPFLSLVLSFSVFALGFLARPLGGVVLSGLGDRYGRRPVFLGSLFCTTAATILIGVLPAYAEWGLAAPLLLVGLRLIQGVCLGGELPGALTYAVEAAPQRAGIACGFIILCVNAGVLVATLVNLGIQHLLPPADVASYGWRVAFLLGGLIGCICYALRRSLEDSPEFLRMRSHPTSPILEVLRQHAKAVLTAAGVAAVIGGFNGVLYGFMPPILCTHCIIAPRKQRWR
jgi:MHS family proline/betaine transporter-like MFS transporter